MTLSKHKYLALVLSGGVLLAIGSCGQFAIDALYLLPNLVSAFGTSST